MYIDIHVSTCRHITKKILNKNIDSGQNVILKHTAKIGGRKKKKRVEAPLGTRHMGCLTLEDIDIVEWQVGLEVALSENCHYRSLKRWRKIVLLDL